MLTGERSGTPTHNTIACICMHNIFGLEKTSPHTHVHAHFQKQQEKKVNTRKKQGPPATGDTTNCTHIRDEEEGGKGGKYKRERIKTT